MTYAPAEDVFTDADSKIALAKTLAERFRPINGTAAETYLIATRKIPATAVSACSDLRYLPPPIEGRPPQDHALVSLLCDGDGAVSGFQCEFIDILGARSGTAPGKQAYAVREHGVRDGLFSATRDDSYTCADISFLCEGYSSKPLAVAALGVGRVYGGGGLHMLGFAVPPQRTVVIVPDAPPPADRWSADGQERLLDQHEAAYARAVDRLILAKRTVLIAAAPDCALHATCKDADAYLLQHGPLRLEELIRRTVPGELSRAGEVKRLAAIEGELDRAAAIKQAWKDKASLHGVPIALLREHVEAERTRGQPAAAVKSGSVEPWDEPVELGAVLNELVAELGRYIATPAANLHTAALWAAMTHVYDRLYCAPKLALQSPTPQCGKTTFLDCLSNVVCRPEPVSGVAPGAFIRTSDAERPTWLLDEADRYLNPKTAGEALTQAINAASYRRLARMRISVPTPDGGWTVQAFEFWCPMLLAGIRRLADTVQDRSIVLKMQRARPGQLKHRLINGSSPRFRDAQRKFIRWAQDLEQLDVDPAVPRFLHNREADLWRPLFSLAAEAGGRWPQRVEQAARTIHGQRAEESDRLVELLLAIKDCFGNDQQLATGDLITRLINRIDEPWDLRSMLAGIVRREKPKQRIGTGFWRGYLRSDFNGAWLRYLPSEAGQASATSATSATGAETPGKQPRSEGADQEGASATVRHEADENARENDCGASVANGLDDAPPTQALDIVAEIEPVAHVADVADQKTGLGVYILTCSSCGATFEHDAHKRGRRPSKCPECRGGSGRSHATVEQVVDQVVAGSRCGYCGAAFRPGEAAVEIAGKRYHDDDACAGTVRRQLAAPEAR